MQVLKQLYNYLDLLYLEIVLFNNNKTLTFALCYVFFNSRYCINYAL